MNMHVCIYDIASIRTILPFLLGLKCIPLQLTIMSLLGLVSNKCLYYSWYFFLLFVVLYAKD